MARSIAVIVRPDGTLQIEAQGFQGAECERATAFLEKALGRVKARDKKPAWYQRARREQRVGT